MKKKIRVDKGEEEKGKTMGEGKEWDKERKREKTKKRRMIKIRIRNEQKLEKNSFLTLMLVVHTNSNTRSILDLGFYTKKSTASTKNVPIKQGKKGPQPKKVTKFPRKKGGNWNLGRRSCKKHLRPF